MNKMQNQTIGKIFTNSYYKATYELGELYLCHLILNILRKIGAFEILSKRFLTSAEIADILTLGRKATYSIEWLLRFLMKKGFVEEKQNKIEKSYGLSKEKVNFKFDGIRDLILKIDKKVLPSCEFMESVCEQYPSFLKGEITGFQALFVKDKMQGWMKYFSNNNSGYAVYNYFGAFGMSYWLPKSQKIRILELGGGTGSAAVAVLDAINQQHSLNCLQEYIFSDVSPLFLRVGKKNIEESFSRKIPLNILKIDFNKPFIEQGLENDKFDVVYAVNSLHVAKNIMFTIHEISSILKKAGLLIVSECVRADAKDTLVQELILNLLDDYLDVEIDRELRPTPGFLPYNNWLKIFNVAGLQDVKFMLNTDCITQENNTHRPIQALIIKGERR